MVNEHVKRCLTSSVIKGMQTKTTTRYHYIPTRMVKIKNTNCGEIGTLLYFTWECKMIQQLWKTIWQFLYKLNVHLPLDPFIPLLVIYLRAIKAYAIQISIH